MAKDNPFSPTFGASPPVLAGRDDILTDVGDALDLGPTHPDYTCLFVGVRGAGKTVMLNAVEDLARERGWLTISENASPKGLLDRILRTTREHIASIGDPPARRRLSGVAAAGFGVELDVVDSSEELPDLRRSLTTLADALAENHSGLIITVDELQSGDLDELREFGGVLQHVTRREQRPVAFAGAGLPQIEGTLLADQAATFLQRCSRHDIDRLSDDATAKALSGPIADRRGHIDHDGLTRAVEATSGYAFMVQLVGFHTWKAASDPIEGITRSEVEKGIAEAETRIGRLVLAPTWRTLSDVDRRFLIAMARDAGESRLGDIAARLQVDVNYAGVYRHRLLGAGMIVATGKGRIDFAHHATREWLRDEAAYAASTFPDD